MKVMLLTTLGKLTNLLQKVLEDGNCTKWSLHSAFAKFQELPGRDKNILLIQPQCFRSAPEELFVVDSEGWRPIFPIPDFFHRHEVGIFEGDEGHLLCRVQDALLPIPNYDVPTRVDVATIRGQLSVDDVIFVQINHTLSDVTDYGIAKDGVQMIFSGVENVL
jgi:hypothetical protein